MASEWSRELLVADIVLDGALASFPAVTAVLHEYRTTKAAPDTPFESFLADRLQLTPAARESLHSALEQRLAAADGDPSRALAAADRERRSLQLSLHASAGPRAEADQGYDADPETLRTVGPDRFGEPMLAGEGGMGLVYMVRDHELRRYVALKAIKAPSADGQPVRPAPESPFDQTLPGAASEGAERYEELRRRFLNEARITGKLEHPGIVPVYELGKTTAGVHVYTMKFVSTHRTLADDIEARFDKPLAERMALIESLLKVCDAMEYAHTQGVLHRDLKPSNIAIGEFGEVLILDWGLAKVDGPGSEEGQTWPDAEPEGATSSTETPPTAIGTPGWMAPEAARGDLAAMGPHSDVYALGVILYEILVGRQPHEAATLHEMLYLTMEVDAEEPATYDVAIPPGLSAVAHQAVERDGAKRPTSAGDLAKAIRAWQVADEETRELARLEREAREALAGAQAARADERLRLVERAALRLQQIGERRPDTADLAERMATVDQLRSRGTRERAWRLIRIPLAAAAALVIGVVFSNAWLASSRIEDQLDSARHAAQAGRPHAARALARQARGAAEERTEDALLTGRTADQLADAFRIEMGSWVAQGDLEGLARSAATALAADQAGGGSSPCRETVAAACAQLGMFDVTRDLLQGRTRGASNATALLVDAYLRLDQRAEARALANAAGDRSTVSLLDRYEVLERISVPGALGIVNFGTAEVPRFAIVTVQGRTYVWEPLHPDSAQRAPRAVQLANRLRSPLVTSDRRGTFRMHGRRRDPGATERMVILEVDVDAGTETVIHSAENTTPRLARADLNGDGAEEQLLLFGAGSRGLRVLDAAHRPWSADRLGELAPLMVEHVPTANVDLYDAIVYPPRDGVRTLLLGTGPWNRTKWGFGVVQCELGPEPGAIRVKETHRIGVVDEFTRADLDGDGLPESYLGNSYGTNRALADVSEAFLPHGIYRFDPHDLAGSMQPVRASPLRGFFHDEAGALQPAAFGWHYHTIGQLERDDGTEAMLLGVDLMGTGVRKRRRYLELLFHNGWGYRAIACPEVYPLSEAAVLCQAEVDPRAPGDELTIVGGNGALLVLGRRTESTPAAATPLAAPVELPTVWSLAEGLRRAGYASLAAELYESPAYHPSGTNPDRWRRCVRCRLEADDPAGAARALEAAHANNGIPKIEREIWEARIALRSHKLDHAHDRYRAAAADLRSPTLRADLEARPGLESTDLLAEEVAAAMADLESSGYAGTKTWTFAGTPGSLNALPEDWASSPPLAAVTAPSGSGADVVLDARRDQWMHAAVELPEVASLETWARFEVKAQPYGSQLAFCISQSRKPDLPVNGGEQDAIWVFFDKGDATPRGVGSVARTGGALASYRLAEGNTYNWEWDRVLRLEVRYQRLLTGAGARIGLSLRDDLTGKLLAGGTIRTLAPLNAGLYRVGFWGSHHRNQWNKQTAFRVYEVGLRVRGRSAPALRIVPHPDRTDDGPAPLERSLRLWREGKRDAAVDQLVQAAEGEPTRLASWLVGPRAITVTDLAAACLQRVPAIEAALFAKDADVGRGLINVDPELLAGLHDRGLVKIDTRRRTMILATALEALGRLRDTWLALGPIEVPPGSRFHLKTRLAADVAIYDHALSEDRFHENHGATNEEREEHLTSLLRGALMRGDEERAQQLLLRLQAESTLHQDSLKDDPAIRRLLRATK